MTRITDICKKNKTKVTWKITGKYRTLQKMTEIPQLTDVTSGTLVDKYTQ